MKLTVFFHAYLPFHETKDNGQIPLGLNEIGIETQLLTLSKKELSDHHPSFPLIQISQNELNNENFWLENNSDVVLAYTWLHEAYNPMIEKIKSAGKKVIVKADSDGRIGYPWLPSHLSTPLSEELTLEHVIEHVWQRLPLKFLHRSATRIAQERIRQIELCDAVIIESPGALSNLNYFLAFWGRQDLIKKTFFVPDPVSSTFIEAEIVDKQDIVVSFGRLDDFKQKNTFAMVDSTVEFLEKRPKFVSIIFGKGKELVNDLTQKVPTDVADRLQVLGFIEMDRIKQVLSTAKMIFIPSRWESFGIAAAESLCMGCSVVATPIESFRYLTMQGFSGSLSANSRKNSLLAALIQDEAKWERGYYEPQKIAVFWRNRLDRKRVARDIVDIVQKL
jgi:glycosyltransferase involved in cell wall biosynthesis